MLVSVLANNKIPIAMKFFKQIPTMKSKPLSHDKKHQLILTYIGGAWYLTHMEA